MSIEYAFSERPDDGATLNIADDIEWLRMPLPFSLNHINLWLLKDGDRWAIVDTGVGTSETKDHWHAVFAGTMGGNPASQVIATHMHPDHVGCAGFLARHFDIDVWMPRDEYMMCRILVADTGRDAPEAHERISDNDVLVIGGHRWHVICGGGHSPEHACLYDRDRNILISGDQLLPTISSNVSVWPTEPLANPLQDWFDSLHKLRAAVPEDVLVLPAHGKPFRGAHERIATMIREHEERLDILREFCVEPQRAVDVFAAIYRTTIDDKNRIMATGEALSHLNYLVRASELRAEYRNEATWYQTL